MANEAEMPKCKCGEPHDGWPGNDGGELCQMCWEAQCSNTQDGRSYHERRPSQDRCGIYRGGCSTGGYQVKAFDYTQTSQGGKIAFSLGVHKDLTQADVNGFKEDMVFLADTLLTTWAKRERERKEKLEAALSEPAPMLESISRNPDEYEDEAEDRSERAALREEVGKLKQDRDEWKDAAQTRGAEAAGLMRDCDGFKATLERIPEQVLDVMGAVSDESLTVEQMLDFLRQKKQQRDDWEKRATERIEKLQLDKITKLISTKETPDGK